jgi:hypothetical protein
MKTTFDIVDRFVSILNVSSITSQIDGRVFRGDRALGATTQDVSIVPLSINNDAIQSGIVNVNFHCPDLSNGTANHDKLDAVSKLIIAALEAYQSTSLYFTFDIEWQRTLSDEPMSSFSNIRIRYYIEN